MACNLETGRKSGLLRQDEESFRPRSRFVRLVASGLSVCSTQGKPKYVTQYVDGDMSTDLLSRKQSIKLAIEEFVVDEAVSA